MGAARKRHPLDLVLPDLPISAASSPDPGSGLIHAPLASFVRGRRAGFGRFLPLFSPLLFEIPHVLGFHETSLPHSASYCQFVLDRAGRREGRVSDSAVGELAL